MGRRHSRSHKKRKIYLDVILIEGENINTRKLPSKWGSLFSSPSTGGAVYCRMKMGEQERLFSQVQTQNDIIWNEDATFSYYFADEASLNLRVEIIEQDKGVFTTTEYTTYCQRLNLKKIEEDKLIDTWIELRPVAQAGAPPITQPQTTPARVHLLLFRSFNSSTGMLNYYGKPNSRIPVRLDVGDVILVNSSYFLTHGIKLTTFSQWDHVAMVGCYENKRSLCLFEATGDGVATYQLNSTLDTYLTSCTIAIRRLALIRTEEMKDSLIEFIQEVKGRPYKFSVWNMVKTRFGTHQSDDLSSLFCSQLIGAAYQRMGIIPEGVSISNLLPTHFEMKQQYSPEDIEYYVQNKLGKMAVFHRSITNETQPKPSAEVHFDVGNPERSICSVDIASSELVTPEGGGSPFTVYNIEVVTEAGRNVVVSRRYSQFFTLHSELKKLFVGIPSLPPKTISGKLSSSVIEARKTALKVYLELLLDDNNTRKCDVLIDFLLNDSITTAGDESVFSEPEESVVKKEKHRKRRKSRRSRKSLDDLIVKSDPSVDTQNEKNNALDQTVNSVLENLKQIDTNEETERTSTPNHDSDSGEDIQTFVADSEEMLTSV